MFQHVGFYRVKSICRITEAARREKFFSLLHERVPFRIISKLHRYAALIVGRGCWLGAEFATAQSAQPG